MATPMHVLRNQAQGMKSTFGLVFRFRREMYPHWRALLGALLFSLGYTATRLAEPWPLKFVLDNVLTGQPLRTPIPALDRLLAADKMRILIVSAGAILVLAVLRGIFYYYQRFLASRVGQEVVLSVRHQLFAHMQRLSLAFHARRSTGDMLTRLTSDINLLRDLLVASLLSLISEGIILIGYTIVMFVMEWRLALMAVVAMPVIFVLMSVYSGRIRDATRKQRRREGELASRLQQTLSGIHIVQLFAREEAEEENLRRLNEQSLNSGMAAARLEAGLNRSVEISLAIVTAATLWLGATSVMAGRLTPGELVVFVAYMQNRYKPLRRVSRVTERSQKASSCVERITDVLDERTDVPDGLQRAPRFRGHISFDGVQFGYRADAPILRGVTLDVRPGQMVALVGASGSGKSTLLGLVPRLFDPKRGRVRIDGVDVRSFRTRSLRERIAVVPQDSLLFLGTLRENIAYGRPDATDAQIEAAAKAAFIHEHIVSLPDGYDTKVAERGVTLSGGQRQRIAIARAIVKDAPIVLLDEPTTGLDSESEALVIQALDRLLKGRTSIVIAHRLSTIRRADVIAVMYEGRIVEKGVHEELMARGGRYRKLYEQQMSEEQTVDFPAAR